MAKHHIFSLYRTVRVYKNEKRYHNKYAKVCLHNGVPAEPDAVCNVLLRGKYMNSKVYVRALHLKNILASAQENPF